MQRNSTGMIEPELKQELDLVNKNLETVSRKLGGNRGAFFRGVLSGIGSIIGVAIAVAIIGWILNTLGYIPAFSKQVNEWKDLIQQTQRR